MESPFSDRFFDTHSLHLLWPQQPLGAMAQDAEAEGALVNGLVHQPMDGTRSNIGSHRFPTRHGDRHLSPTQLGKLLVKGKFSRQCGQIFGS